LHRFKSTSHASVDVRFWWPYIAEILKRHKLVDAAREPVVGFHATHPTFLYGDSDGISEDIITALSKLRWFFVIARNSSFIYKGKAVHIKQLGEELGVGYVVEGSVRKDGDRVRITAQLNDVATGSHIWAERYDRSLSDVFAMQDDITEAIVAAIEPQLYAAENFRARRKPPDSMDAWDLVMRALSHYWRATRQDTRRHCLRRRSLSTPTMARRMACLPPATRSVPTWDGRTWRK
jgi:TolB-like protein